VQTKRFRFPVFPFFAAISISKFLFSRLPQELAAEASPALISLLSRDDHSIKV
jgi:hypothetical protein